MDKAEQVRQAEKIRKNGKAAAESSAQAVIFTSEMTDEEFVNERENIVKVMAQLVEAFDRAVDHGYLWQLKAIMGNTNE